MLLVKTISNHDDNINSSSKESTPKAELQFPIKVNKSLLALTQYLTEREQEEIKKYTTIYYINLDPKAVRRKLRKESTASYDDENGDYILIAGEHIAYRYEILDRYDKFIWLVIWRKMSFTVNLA